VGKGMARMKDEYRCTLPRYRGDVLTFSRGDETGLLHQGDGTPWRLARGG